MKLDFDLGNVKSTQFGVGWDNNGKELFHLISVDCTENKVDVQNKDGMLVVSDSHVMGFLEALDRRLYGVTLIPNHKERFKANSRSKVGED